jgi:bifunctional ADP-heptose synthase (sugar kinase/adenylyltransferase)
VVKKAEMKKAEMKKAEMKKAEMKKAEMYKELVTRGDAGGAIFQYGRERSASRTRAVVCADLPSWRGAGGHRLPAVFAVRAYFHAWTALVERLCPRWEDCGCS